jgi:hypothetical protein
MTTSMFETIKESTIQFFGPVEVKSISLHKLLLNTDGKYADYEVEYVDKRGKTHVAYVLIGLGTIGRKEFADQD